MTVSNLLNDLPIGAMPEESIEALLKTESFRIERIVSKGHVSPPGFWYDQSGDEWVLLVAGHARLRFEGEEPIELVPGSYINIPAHQRHRVEWTDPVQPTVWLTIHSG